MAFKSMLTVILLVLVYLVSMAEEQSSTQEDQFFPMEEIVVTASREMTNLYYSPASITVISWSEIEARNV
ncbi:MAG: hypothetical protein ACE5WD_10115 [Candidatus Aminicenantia bacterium]